MAGTANRLIFANSEKARDAITEAQKKEIVKLYEDWAKDLGERAKYYEKKTTASSFFSERQAKELQKALREQSQQISNEVYKGIKQNIYTISDAVVRDNVEWLKSLGFSGDNLSAAFSSIPDSTVRMLVTGQIYEGGWNLSSRIWSSNEKTLSNCYRIVAKGMAENTPIYNIAKELEKYVSPSTAKAWNPVLRTRNTKTGEWEYKKIYKGKVDYNAQRLARTLVQHGYQQSFIATTKNNPFVLRYRWSSNGSRVCEMCLGRDGQEYSKDELPMDHPNGMCTMIPVIEDNLVDRLADWYNSPDGTYPEIDEFSKNFGYEPGKAQTPSKATLPSPTVPKATKASAAKAAKEVPKIPEPEIPEAPDVNSKEWLTKNAAPQKIFKNTGMDVKKDREAVVDRLMQDSVSEDYRKAFANAAQRLKKVTGDAEGSSYYSPRDRHLNLTPNFKTLKKDATENVYNTLFHEMGHAIDASVPGTNAKYSSLGRIGFDKAMVKDLDNLAASIKSGRVSINDLGALSFQKGTTGVQDILGAAKHIDAKYNDISKAYYRWGHSDDYWKRRNAKAEAASELFAHISAAQVSEQEMAVVKKYFPGAVEKFAEAVKEVASKTVFK